jgi:hypothetical protein
MSVGSWLACGLVALLVAGVAWLTCRRRRRAVVDMAQIGGE